MALSDQNSVDALIAQVQQDAAAVQANAQGADAQYPPPDAAAENPAPVDGAMVPGDAAAAIDQASAAAADLANEIAGDMEPPGAAPAPSPAIDTNESTLHPSAGTHAAAADVSRLLAIEVPVIVQLGMRRLTVGEVMRLAVGAIVEFGKSAEEELDLLVNNKAVGKGQAVKVGENFGIKVTSIGSVKETIKKLGS